MTPCETALFLTAGIASGTIPFLLSAYRGGGRRVILQVVAVPGTPSYLGLAGATGLAYWLSPCAPD